MKLLRAFITSMTGRMFFLLVGGMVAAAVIAGFASNFNTSRVLKRQSDERAADQLQAFIAFVENAPPEWRSSMQRMNGPGIQIHPVDTAGGEPDPAFARLLAARGGVLATATADTAAPEQCFASRGGRQRGGISRNGWSPGPRPGWGNGEYRGSPGQAGERFLPPECRLVSVMLGDGTPMRLSVEAPGGARTRSRLLDPAFMILFGTGIVALALLAALRASAPLRRLAQASTQLGQDLHRQPLAVAGSSEMRQAITAFNSMQARLQTHVAERTQMLAAITHDLQTPLTRLRLRLERVEDAELRERLVGDMQSMRALIDEGLELARTAETPEAVVMLDLDSVLESLVEDAVEAGLAAEFTGGCGAVLPLRPLATRRVFANLIDNALVHGGSAAVRAGRDAQSVCVFVRDRGPGIPEELLERVFDPFFRPDNSRSRETGGTGLGLTIARMLATKIGATLKLRNHPQGGVEAEVRWPTAAGR